MKSPETQNLHSEIVDGAFKGERLSLSRVRSRCPKGFYTREMFKEATGLSETEMRALIARGQLTPAARNPLGWALYNDASIEKLREKPPPSDPKTKKLPSLSKSNFITYSAAEALAVFRHIELGTTLTAVALELNMHPAIVMAIQSDYAVMHRSMVVPHQFMEKVNALEGKIEGKFPVETMDDVLAVLQGAAERLPLCTCCKKKPRKLCLTCARKQESGSETEEVKEGVRED